MHKDMHKTCTAHIWYSTHMVHVQYHLHMQYMHVQQVALHNNYVLTHARFVIITARSCQVGMLCFCVRCHSWKLLMASTLGECRRRSPITPMVHMWTRMSVAQAWTENKSCKHCTDVLCSTSLTYLATGLCPD